MALYRQKDWWHRLRLIFDNENLLCYNSSSKNLFDNENLPLFIYTKQSLLRIKNE